ncbi:MAG TPA: protein TolR [Hyphomicrobiaceae bacterium]|nr:protein TolR [Hyphomicrobiaceae bacterium]
MGASLNAGGAGGGRRGRRARKAPMSEINVTPFVDVMLVLLIIFMVAAPLLATGVPLDLPSAKSKQLETQNKEPVVVSITRESKIFLGQEDKADTPLDDLAGKLKAIAETRGGTEEPIFVRGANLAEYGFVAKVLSRLSEAGFKKISLVTDPGSGG